MYFRGGKVWIGQKARGLVFLEKDWKQDRLPEDLVEEAGLLGTDFKLLDKTSRAKLGGYSIFENFVKFVVDPSSIKGMGENPKIRYFPLIFIDFPYFPVFFYFPCGWPLF